MPSGATMFRMEAEEAFARVGAETIIATYSDDDVEPTDAHVARVAQVFANQPGVLDEQLGRLSSEKRQRLNRRASDLAATLAAEEPEAPVLLALADALADGP